VSRLDLVIERHPDREAQVRFLASRDPSGTLKYLQWQVNVLASGKAPATEIADVVDLFHKFRLASPKRHTHADVRPDLYSYKKEEFTTLRDELLRVQRAQDKMLRFEGVSRTVLEDRIRELVTHVLAEAVQSNDLRVDLRALTRHVEGRVANASHSMAYHPDGSAQLAASYRLEAYRTVLDDLREILARQETNDNG
jgi:hypothetical protein